MKVEENTKGWKFTCLEEEEELLESGEVKMSKREVEITPAWTATKAKLLTARKVVKAPPTMSTVKGKLIQIKRPTSSKGKGRAKISWGFIELCEGEFNELFIN